MENGFPLWLLTTLLSFAGLGWLAWTTIRHARRAASEAGLVQIERTASQVKELLLTSMETRASLAHSVQSVGLARYPAFRQTGAGTSFSLALADGQGNGVVLSFINGQQTTRVYAKPLRLWGSDQPLSDEEQQAIADARDQPG